MFRSKTRERRIFTNRKPVRRNFSGLAAIASVALFLLVLELLTRIFVDISGNRSKYARAEVSSEVTQAYRLKFVSSEFEPDLATEQNMLLAKPALSVGYKLLGDRQTEYWQLNEQGFRDGDPVPLVKPQGEIRIFILGGSTAFGYGSSSNATTISEQLEKRLARRLEQQKTSPRLYKPDTLPFEEEKRKKSLAKPSKIKTGNYRVINASVPGYASGNELAQLALQILKYKPDLIVVLDGYEDLMLSSDEEATQVPQLKNSFGDRQDSWTNYVSQVIKPIENKSYIAKIAQEQWLNTQKDDNKADLLLNEETSKLIKYLPSSESELQARVDRYASNQKQILSLSAATGVPLVVAMQPEITGRNPSQLTDAEGKIAQELGRTYIKKVRTDYPVLIQKTQQLASAFPNNMKAVDLYKLTDRYPSPSFIDAIHLNEAANEKAAEQIYYAISSFSKMQVVPKQAPAPAPKPRSQYVN